MLKRYIFLVRCFLWTRLQFCSTVAATLPLQGSGQI